MSRVYARREDNGQRVLVCFECDAPGCDATIKPHPEIGESGWTVRGQDNGPGTEKLEWDYCPDHGETP